MYEVNGLLSRLRSSAHKCQVYILLIKEEVFNP